MAASFLASLFLWASFPAHGQEQVLDDPHYTLYRTWALSPATAESPFKITTFLPEGYLFHVLERDAQVVSNNRYSLVLTQDGVEALLYSGAISHTSFNQSVGDHELIFNTPYRLCRTAFCNKTQDGTWAIGRSDAFKIVREQSSSSSSLVKIKATRGWEIIEGYLSGEELAELTELGLVTRTDRVLPRYRITKSKSDALSTSCGEKRSVSDVLKISSADRTSFRLAKLLRMNANDLLEADAGQIELTRDYGSDGYQYSFYLYEIEDRGEPEGSETRFFQAAAGFKISCSQNHRFNTQTKDYIDHMVFVNSRNQINGQPVEVNLSSNLFNTPRDIRQYTGDAYMISINKPEHFEQAIEILSKKIGDRTLAGYMLSELNRSCRSELRVQYSGSVCRIYDY